MTKTKYAFTALILFFGCAGSTKQASLPTSENGEATPIFAATSPFNVAVPKDPVLDPRSNEMVAYLARKKQAHADLYEFGIPIWEASDATPRSPVKCSMAPAWGKCPFGEVPIPENAHPHTGSDGAMVVIDRSAQKSYEFWQIRRDGGAWLTSWGAIQDLNGTGWSKNGSSTATGASRLGGVVRVNEIAHETIRHALVMSIDNACTGTFRPPAMKTDGDSTRADCTPEGARLQLDPAIDVATLPGITAAERAVGKALQTYGIYVIDKGGAPMGISFELAPDATSAKNLGTEYQAAGLAWDYFGMPHLPWDRLRVLAHWDGS